MHQAPVVTVDGPSGAGKGTVSLALANRKGWHFLDSGAIYRVLTLASMHHHISTDDEDALVPLASGLDVNFETQTDGFSHIILEGEDVTQSIRAEEVGKSASQIASLPRVREALLRRQRAFRELPGLIADGRDMGTVVFPNADVKVFLTASAEERANRRYNQLLAAGMLQEAERDVSIARLLTDIKARDERDSNRSVAPLVPAENAIVIDSTSMNVEQVIEKIEFYINEKLQA